MTDKISEDLRELLKEAIIRNNRANAHLEELIVFLRKKYSLADTDQIDGETGEIKHAPEPSAPMPVGKTG